MGTVEGGALLPGATATNTFTVDTAVNPFFTYAAMVIPSNDFFLGNDSPTALRLFDAGGNLILNGFTLKANRIWDAGSEAFDPANAAFLVDGVNDRRTPQNGVVNFNFRELSGFNGLETAAGYTFNSQLTADTDVFRVSFRATPAVPVPPSVVMALTGVLWFVGVRRWRV